jgi:hypothetical protein
MSKDIHITIKNADDFAFTLMLVGLVLLFFAFVAFAPETKHAPETQEWLDSQPARPSNGLEW